MEKLRTQYGGRVMLGEIARQLAAGRGCALAQDAANSRCSVRSVEPPVHHWAELDHARLGGWETLLRCGRRHAALKKAKSCPGAVPLDILHWSRRSAPAFPSIDCRHGWSARAAAPSRSASSGLSAAAEKSSDLSS